MDIKKYLEGDSVKISRLAADLGITRANVYQWARGIRPVPVERCSAIEAATNGVVSRRDLRPNDWQEIWPELKEPNHA